MTDTPISGFTLETLRDQLQTIGYRVESVTHPADGSAFLRSSTAGLAFDIRPGNRLADANSGFADFTFGAWLQVEGQLPLEVVNRWNTLRRFGRLQALPGLLALTMDLSVMGGVTPAYVRAQVEIWDRLVQELLPYLREELQKLMPVQVQQSGEAAAATKPSDIKPVGTKAAAKDVELEANPA